MIPELQEKEANLNQMFMQNFQPNLAMFGSNMMTSLESKDYSQLLKSVDQVLGRGSDIISQSSAEQAINIDVQNGLRNSRE